MENLNEINRLHNWSFSKIERLYNPKGSKPWLTIHLYSLINQAVELGYNKAEKRIEDLECQIKEIESQIK